MLRVLELHRLVFHNLRSSFAQDPTTLRNEGAPVKDDGKSQYTTREDTSVQ